MLKKWAAQAGAIQCRESPASLAKEVGIKAKTCSRACLHRCRRLFALTVSATVMAFVIAAPSAATDSSAPVLHLANGEWPPYTGQHLPDYGCDSQVVTEAFSLEGITVRYEFLPWARGLLLSQNGVLDGAVEWAGTPEQQRSHYVSRDALSRQEWVFFHRKDKRLEWNRLEDLRDYSIGLTIGYAYSDVFADLQAQQPAMFQEATSDLLNFKKLMGGRIDLFPLEKAVGQHLMAKELTPAEQERIAMDHRSLAEFSPRLLLSRAVQTNQQRMQLFDQGLEKLKANGRYRQIMARCAVEEP